MASVGLAPRVLDRYLVESMNGRVLRIIILLHYRNITKNVTLFIIVKIKNNISNNSIFNVWTK